MTNGAFPQKAHNPIHFLILMSMLFGIFALYRAWGAGRPFRGDRRTLRGNRWNDPCSAGHYRIHLAGDQSAGRRSLAAAVAKLERYALRWKAKVFHKVMKSGRRAEEARLETAERLAKLLALITIVSWRIFFLTMSARAMPDTEPRTVLTPAEIATLDSIDEACAKPRILRRTPATYPLQIAMLGGYLARNHDPPPGNMVVWRGTTSLNDIAIGISIGTRRRCGN